MDVPKTSLSGYRAVRRRAIPVMPIVINSRDLNGQERERTWSKERNFVVCRDLTAWETRSTFS